MKGSLLGKLGQLALCAAVIVAGAVAEPVQASVADKLLSGCRLLSGGRWQVACQAFQEASQEDAQCAEALLGAGVAQLQAGYEDAALDYFAKALALDPQLGAAHLARGTACYLKHDLVGAWSEYQRALTAGVSEQAAARATAAQVACMLGEYAAAETVAAEALALDGDCELALQVQAAAALARGHAADTLRVLGTAAAPNLVRDRGIMADSPLFTAYCRYYVENQLATLQQLGAKNTPRVAVGNVPGVGGTATGVFSRGDSSFRLDWPKPGAQVSGRLEVAVSASPDLNVQYVAVLIDEQFAGMSNSQPYRVWVDSRLGREGLREIRVDGYGADGTVVRSASVLVNVTNGQRTLAESEQRVRRSVVDFLESYVVLRASPVLRAQLAGHALESLGRLAEAVDAYEYAFSYEPALPGIRGDLLLCYGKLGVTGAAGAHEIHSLPGDNHVALTFDDGPHPVLTPWILDLLDKYQAKATFLLVGRQAEMYPELTREISRRGHEIGSHSYTHANLRQLSELGVERELVMSRLMIRRACGDFVTLFRPPGGNYDPQVRQAVGNMGFSAVFWTENITSYPGQSGPEILPRMLGKIGSNAIVLLHNGYDETREVLPLLLPALAQRGLRMDTVSALGGHRRTAVPTPSLYPVDWAL